MLEHIVVELSDGTQGGWLLLNRPAPLSREVFVSCDSDGGLLLNDQPFAGRLPDLSVKRPQGPTKFGNTSARLFPSWMVVEAPGPRDEWNTSFIQKPKHREVSSREPDSGVASVLFDKESPLVLFAEATPKDRASLAYAWKRQIEGRRIQWVDAWGVVRMDVTLRWRGSR